MSNRNLNGLNSSVRNLTGISGNLQDGIAIKIRNTDEIDVNMKSNTTEQTTLGNTDLFLLSDTTGANIKYITATNLKQKTLLDLNGGTNINLTVDAHGDTVINLDATLTGITNINSYVANVLTLNNNDQQFLVKDTNKNFSANDILSVDSNNKITNITSTDILADLVAGTNLNKSSNTINLDATLTGITNINSYVANVLTLNNNDQQYLIKDTNKNFSANDILSVDSNNKITNITSTNVLSDLVAGTNLNKSGNTINLDNTLSLTGSITSTTFVKINNSSATEGGELQIEGSQNSIDNDIFGKKFILDTFFSSSIEQLRLFCNGPSSSKDLLYIENITATTHDINFKTAFLTNVNKINSFTIGDTVNNTNSQFLIKDTNSFSNGDYLFVANNKVSNQSLANLKTEVFNSITAGTGLNKSGTDSITLNIDTNLQGLTILQLNANSDVLGGIIRLNPGSGGQANTNQFELLNAYNSSGFQSGKIDSGYRIRTQSIDKLFCGHQEDNNECVYINPDNTTNFIFNLNQFKMIKQDNSSADFNIGVGGSTSSLIFNLIDGSTTDTHKFSFRSGNVEKAFVSSTGKGYLNKLSLGTATTFNTDDTILLEQSGLAQMTIHSSGGNESKINFKKSSSDIGHIKIDSNNFLNYNISTGNSHIFTVNSIGKCKIENTQTTITTDNTKTIFNTGGNMTISHLSSTHIAPIIKCDTGTLNFDSSNGSTQAIDFSLSGSETLLIRNDKVEVKKNLVINTFNINTTDCDINNNGDIIGTNCDIKLDGDLVFQHTSGSVDIKGTSSSLDINFTIARTFNFYRPTAHFDEQIRLRGSTDTNHIISYTNDESVDGVLLRGNLGGLVRSTAYGTHARWLRSGTQNQFQSNHFAGYSDDRIKYGEAPITDALSTIKKINPVSYRKTNGLGEADSPTLNLEWGIVAQELYNNVPEMRHAVQFDKTLTKNFVDGDITGNCVNDIYSYNVAGDGTITDAPDIVALQYDNFHALNIKAIQELLARVELLESQLSNFLTQS